MQPGLRNLKKVAVVGQGTAGSLAAACVTRQLPEGDHELHHIYDSRIPVIGVGEGSWPSLVHQLQQLTNLPHETVQRRLTGTRKYGVAFEGWGRSGRDFTHYFAPQQVSYGYHLAADRMAELLQEGTKARHIDTKVRGIESAGGRAHKSNSRTDRRNAMTWSSMHADFPAGSIPTGTSTFPSSRRTPPSSAGARPSSRSGRTFR